MSRPLAVCCLSLSWGLELLELQVEGGELKEYKVERLRYNLIRLEKRDGTVYVTGAFDCTCPWWRFVGIKTGECCKHQICALQMGLVREEEVLAR